MPRLVTSDGIDLAYEVRGTGSPLLLIHGATTTAAYDWSRIDDLLPGQRILVDMRGHGRSGTAGKDILTPVYMADLITLLDELSIPCTDIVAFSHFGLAALHLALEHPHRLRRLVVIGLIPWIDHSLLRDTDELARRWPPEIAALHQPRYDITHWRALLENVRRDRLLHGDLKPEQLGMVSAPTMFVVGDRDPYVPVSVMADVTASVPGARLLVVPGARHSVARDEPAVLAAGIRRFLSDEHPWPRDPSADVSTA